MKFAGTMKVVEFEPLLTAEPGVTTPVVAAPLVMLEMVQPAPVVENVAPAPALTNVAPAPVVEFVVPAPAVLHAASAPVDVCVASILESGRMRQRPSGIARKAKSAVVDLCSWSKVYRLDILTGAVFWNYCTNVACQSWDVCTYCGQTRAEHGGTKKCTRD